MSDAFILITWDRAALHSTVLLSREEDRNFSLPAAAQKHHRRNVTACDTLCRALVEHSVTE